jgi:outer membrane protein TolC
MRYRGDTTIYLKVLDSRRSLFDAEPTLAQARNDKCQGLLFSSLGRSAADGNNPAV